MLVINSVQREAVLTKYLGRKGLSTIHVHIFIINDLNNMIILR